MEICHQREQVKLTLNDFVVIQYEEEYFPGTIKDIETDCCFVITMQMSGINKWKWPREVDAIWYSFDEINEKIKAPEEAN